MARSKTLITIASPIAVALALAACGSDNNDNGGGGGGYATGSSAPAKTTTGAAAVDVGRAGALGSILDNGQGRTLYLFEKDSGTTSACSGACAAAWPPLTTSGKATAGTGVATAKLGTTTRSDGSTQVTYDGHPLYTYAGDSAPGQTNGQGLTDFGGGWYVLSPAGAAITR